MVSSPPTLRTETSWARSNLISMAVPKLVTAAIVFDKDEENILLVLNKRDPENTRYGFPGGAGGWKKYTNPYEAVIEEVRGDVGCEFTGKFYKCSFREDEESVVTLFFFGTIMGQPHPVCGNIKDVKYFPLDEARKMDLTYEHNQMLEELLENKAQK